MEGDEGRKAAGVSGYRSVIHVTTRKRNDFFERISTSQALNGSERVFNGKYYVKSLVNGDNGKSLLSRS